MSVNQYGGIYGIRENVYPKKISGLPATLKKKQNCSRKTFFVLDFLSSPILPKKIKKSVRQQCLMGSKLVTYS